MLEDDVPDDDDASLGAFVSWRVVSGANDNASPTYHPVSRTRVVPLTSSAMWHVSCSLRVNAAVWSSPVLEVSLWQQSHWESLQQTAAIPTVTDRRADVLGSSRLLGKARVDLSLLGRRWTFIDGWYHVLDARGMNRGQVKVRVNLPNGAVERVFDTTSVAAFGALEKVSLSSPEHDTSFHQSVKQIHVAAAEVQQRLLDLEEHAEDMDEERAQDEGMNRTELPTAGFPVQAVEDRTLSPDERSLSLEHRDEHADNSNMAFAEVFNESSEILGHVVPESDQTQELEPALAVSQDEEGYASPVYDARLGEQSLVIETGMFMPITLASFGTEEVELSPWSKGSAIAPGSDSPMDEAGSPRFELMEEDSDVETSPDDPMAVRRDEEEIGPIAGEEMGADASGEESTVLSCVEDPTLDLDSSGASDGPVREEIVSSSSRDVGGAESEGDCHEANDSDDDVGAHALPPPEQDDGAASIGEDGVGDGGADGSMVAGDRVDVRDLDVLQLATHETDEHVGEDVEESRQGGSTKTLLSSSLCVDVAVQVNLGEALPKDGLVEGDADSDTAARTSCVRVNRQDEAVDRTHEVVQPPTSAVDSADQETAAPISDAKDVAGDDIDREHATVGEEPPAAAIQADPSCELDPAPPDAATNSTDAPVDTIASPAAHLSSQPSLGYSNDKLDQIIDLLNEILAVCVRTAPAPGAQSTPHEVQDGASSSLGVPSARSYDVRDAQTQVEEDFSADTTSIDSSLIHHAGDMKQQAEVEPVAPQSEVELEPARESPAISVLGSFSSTSSSEEAFRAARIIRVPQLAVESTQTRDVPAANAAGDNLRLHSLVSSAPPPRPLARPPLPLKTDRSSSTLVAVDRLARELSSLYDRKPLAPLSATSTGQSPPPPLAGTPHLRFPPEKRVPLQFPHDSETERIARIMQGSITYWMKESEDGSGGSQDESEDSDSDYLF